MLVHGLGGSPNETWGKFPVLLEQDADLDFGTVLYGYQSPHLFLQFWQRAPSLANIANGLLTDITARCDLEKDEIILAGHSLGGLVIKKMLLIMKDKQINHKIKKVCFFDVPHDGSGYANAGKYLSFRNRHLKSLCRDSNELDDLNDQWVNSGLGNSIEIISIIAANDDIVSSLSSKSIFRGSKVETINDVNHRSIVKPESTNSTSYIVFKKFILERSTVAQYKNAASRDLNDWKSIERNHGYHYVSDEKRSSDLSALIAGLELNRVAIRLTGASGLGKTRLLLEAIDNSSIIDDSCVLVFDAPGYETSIRESVRRMVEDNTYGLVIIENCSSELHDQLAKEVNKTECQLKLVTVGYSNDHVENSVQIQLSTLSDAAIKQVLTPILVGMSDIDVERVARFAQGYPLMATLIAEQYQKQGRLLGSIESNSVIRKLIDGDGGVSDAEKELLSACSLFDVFGTAEGIAGEEARFIAEDVAGSNLKTFDRTMTIFTRRQIINRAGRYARVVPKPLALTLAAEWWNETSYDRQKQLIDNLPDSLMHSFCTQAAYLDSQPSVQRFSDKLFGGGSPFLQAEVLLTERGSKLFRAFVEVNPESTSHALYNVLFSMNREDLQNIGGDTRRNFVWALEKLCFHSEHFEKSSWCMMLLGSAENETWSNNATGMFSQLFRVELSGTQTKPSIRFDLLKRAIACDRVEIDMVVLEALNQAINTYGGTRTIGAEYQGTKAPLEEWRPKVWQDIFDFWQEAFNLLLVMIDREGKQKEKALSIIGHSIRGFVARNRIEMLDSAIKHVVLRNGRYWPEALDSIKNTFTYDSKSLTKESEAALNSWLELLSPKNSELPEKLKILVTNPPWEHKPGEDGRYIDVASENAKELAKEIAPNIESLLPHLSVLLRGEQKQAYSFGYQLAHELTNTDEIIDFSLQSLTSISQPNPTFILGLFRGVFERSQEQWQKNIDQLLADESLTHLYPDFIRTGAINKHHLRILFELIRDNVIPPDSINVLSYGSVTADIPSDDMADFCMQLISLGERSSWPALNVMYMYCFGNEGAIQHLRAPLKRLITTVPLDKDQKSNSMDAHHWNDFALKILKEPDEAFAVSLTNQLITACKRGFNHGDIWNYTKPLLIDLMRNYSNVLWPIFGEAIVQSEGMERYWLQQLLDRENGSAVLLPSVLSAVPVKSVVDWCSAQPEIGPVFVASCLNVLEPVEGESRPTKLFLALLEQFGDNPGVGSTLTANMMSRSWTGSLVPYLISDKESLSPLLEHPISNVRNWTRDYISYVDRRIEDETNRDKERDIGLF
ncbi:hypothetical protein V466_27525 [Pseudomonas mandelii PD30]|uniref:DUF676 domain-containing protein n=1 Tax=Pseudomonas mandelii PD30 TaxID=1419583 RepID=A0A059KUL7_9PSED|nr:hypothetical protein V466_27525 [Pseudomonas mandelii PD30]